jgi:hypothetical protein
MDPLITNGVDPALLRVLDKRGQERNPALRRKRPPAPESPVAEEQKEDQEPDTDAPKHELDDLA